MTLATYTIYAPEVQATIRIAQAIAKEHHHVHYTPAHLLLACLHREISLTASLQAMDIDIYYLEEWAEVRLDSLPKATRPSDEPEPDEHAANVLQEADAVRLEYDLDAADAWCVLIALSTPGVGFSYEQLKTFPLQSLTVLVKRPHSDIFIASPILSVCNQNMHSPAGTQKCVP